MNLSAMFSSQTDMWETPQPLFDELDREFHFTLDACAVRENAKCRHYFTPEEDGLKQDWPRGGGNLYESSLRKDNRKMGKEGGRERRDRGLSSACANGHGMVP